MKKIKVRLKPPFDLFPHTPTLPVYLGDNKKFIGMCEITHDNGGIVGSLNIQAEIDASQFIDYMVDNPMNSGVKLTAIIISSNGNNANTISNLLLN